MYIYIYICICICIHTYIHTTTSLAPALLRRQGEQLPNRRHRDLKAFEEHVQAHVLLLRYRVVLIGYVWVRGWGGAETVHRGGRAQLRDRKMALNRGAHRPRHYVLCNLCWKGRGFACYEKLKLEAAF